MIEEDDQIKGISLPGNENFKVTQYADDNVEAFTDIEECVKITNIIEYFCKASGIEINWNKTIGLLF